MPILCTRCGSRKRVRVRCDPEPGRPSRTLFCPACEARAVRAWKDRNPEKTAAHRAVGRAIRKGRMQRQPCEVCGTTRDVQGHHDDYSDPLAVRWLCRRHHEDEHARLRQAAKHSTTGEADEHRA